MIAAALILAQAAFEREGITVPLPGPGWEYVTGPVEGEGRAGKAPLVRVRRKSDGVVFSVTVIHDSAPFDDALRARLRKTLGEILNEGTGRHGRWETWWVDYVVELEKVGARNRSVWVIAGKRRVLFHVYVPRDKYTPELGLAFDGWVDRCRVDPEIADSSVPTGSWFIAGAGVALAILVMIWTRKLRG